MEMIAKGLRSKYNVGNITCITWIGYISNQTLPGATMISLLYLDAR